MKQNKYVYNPHTLQFEEAKLSGKQLIWMRHIIPSQKLTSSTLPKIFHLKYGLKNDKFWINNVFTDYIFYFFYLKLIFDIYGLQRKNKMTTTNYKLIILILLKILYIFIFFTPELYLWWLLKIDWPREKKSTQVFFSS